MRIAWIAAFQEYCDSTPGSAGVRCLPHRQLIVITGRPGEADLCRRRRRERVENRAPHTFLKNNWQTVDVRNQSLEQWRMTIENRTESFAKPFSWSEGIAAAYYPFDIISAKGRIEVSGGRLKSRHFPLQFFSATEYLFRNSILIGTTSPCNKTLGRCYGNSLEPRQSRRNTSASIQNFRCHLTEAESPPSLQIGDYCASEL